MKVLKVIHGYPPQYNAGSEIYSQNLCHGLAKNNEVHVFTREENAFLPDYFFRKEPDPTTSSIWKHIVNIPLVRHRYRYSHQPVDAIFGALMDEISPDVVHIGHLNHLSTGVVWEVKKRGIPLVFTLHDFWLMCARGQFLQRNPENGAELWKLCDGQENKKCATQCYAGYFSGIAEERAMEMAYWTHWFKVRTDHIKDIVKAVDLFIAPAKGLLEKHRSYFKLASEKVVYLDYGFNLDRLHNRKRWAEGDFVFGYIGTHTPQKGIHELIEAFGLMTSRCRLRIWGRERQDVTPGLKAFVDKLPKEKQAQIDWMGEYQNENIVPDVFNKIDAIVVPSIWEENSPLVIHEAQQAGVPVITADIGGMAEYVHNGKNGLLFKHRDTQDLRRQMEVFVQDPGFARSLGAKRYLHSQDGNIPELSAHVREVESHYLALIGLKKIGDRYGNETRPMADHF